MKSFLVQQRVREDGIKFYVIIEITETVTSIAAGISDASDFCAYTTYSIKEVLDKTWNTLN